MISFSSILSRQLGAPRGILGRLVAKRLNTSNRSVIAAAVETLGLAGGETVADIGFGGGLGLDLLLARVGETGQVNGVEPSPDMIALARSAHSTQVSSGRLHLHRATMQSLPFADRQLDAWISLNTVYFVGDLKPATQELARVLAPGGRGVLGLADPGWLAGQPYARSGFVVRPVDEVIVSLGDAGFEVVRKTVGSEAAPYTLLVCRPAAVRTEATNRS